MTDYYFQTHRVILPNSTPKERELASKMQNVRTEPKIKRNENCPCGSSNKFKKCCIWK